MGCCKTTSRLGIGVSVRGPHQGSGDMPSLPVTILETNFDFVLIGPLKEEGPRKGEQAVLAQSRNLNLLLLGLARTSPHLANDAASKDSWKEDRSFSNRLSRVDENQPRMTLYSMTELANLSAHERNQPITFAWVGWLPDADIKIILNYFKDCAPSLYNATQEDDKGEK